ncbi:MAG: hypothetical protein PHD81_02840 [Candidatus Nanoarchaeia archaeon]|nr:hypothetical protein [Candidatus Nanoarchaeia archaeon]MDD5588021.1 hypothetical protein [Candidatus Nanoarchaeia archaeon]
MESLEEVKELITYESLYETLRKEKINPELQELNPIFFKQVQMYVKDKEAILKSQEGKDSVFSSVEAQKTRKQIENSQKIMIELYERRESKIIQLAMFHSRTNSPNEFNNMLPEEMELYKRVSNELNAFRGSILNTLLTGNLPSLPLSTETKDLKIPENQENTQNTSLKLVKFLNAVPKFVGDDLKVYGPFEEEDMANLPIKVANVLLENQRVELIQ